MDEVEITEKFPGARETRSAKIAAHFPKDTRNENNTPFPSEHHKSLEEPACCQILAENWKIAPMSFGWRPRRTNLLVGIS
jgi:hypothetical protein